jgi:diguanylate cyclase (GGDEF)-like protein/PAS domain S-box-containing protein
MWDYDVTTGRVYLSEGWSQLLGGEQQPTDTTIQELASLVPHEEQAMVRTAIVDAMKGLASDSYQVTHRVKKFNDGYIWVLSEGRVTERDRDGRALRMVGTNRDITERKLAEESLRKLSLAVEQSPSSIIITDLDANIEYVNEAFVRTTGYSPDEVIGRNPRLLGSGKTPASSYREMWANLTSGKTWRGEFINRRKDGSEYIEAVLMSPVRQSDGSTTHYLAIKEDITERKSAERKLVRSEASLRAILDNVPYLIWLKDTESRFIAVNRAFFKTTGLPSIDDVPGKTDFDLWPKALAEKYRADDADVMATRQQKLTEERSLDNGRVTWVETFKAPILDKDGNLIGTTGFARDITERKETEETVRHLAHFDALTDLPNRVMLSDRIGQSLTMAKRDKTHLAIVLLDLDKFKPINDTYGHAVGDLLLQEAGKRMRDSVRESDTVSRLGGDEFVVLLPVIETAHDAQSVAEKILHALNQPFYLAGHKLEISASMGISIYPQHGSDETELVKNADIAMYQSKKDGRNNVKLYQHGMAGDNP